jgi:ArsR family transcriptional regulator, arsenate/arsenite/antimonite-responsive transcriptional repressor
MNLDAGSLFLMLSDETRLRALMLLAAEQELCVCELTHALAVSQPKISRHLAQLRETGLLQARREGQWMYYRIQPDLPDWVGNILHHALLGNSSVEPFRSDRQTLKRMPNRPGAAGCA